MVCGTRPTATAGGLTTERSQQERDDKAAEHARLAECVIAGDTEDAAAVMHQHIATSPAKAAWRLGAPASSKALR
jgi:DNA-binding FadR family transcriptional regulator